MTTHSKFGRKSEARRALFRSLAIACLENDCIKTTLPKAKELRRFVERLVTIAKVDSVHNRRRAFKALGHKQAVKNLFEKAKLNVDRPGGYTKVLKCGYRSGDAAPMAYYLVKP